MPNEQGSHRPRGLAPDALVYLLRHGQTIWNAERRFQGQLDSPLSLLGISQAQAVAARLAREIAAPEDFAIVSSPLGRAWQTASIVAQSLEISPTRISRDSRLAEVGFGDWEGRTWAEVDAGDPGIWERRQAALWTHRPPGGGEAFAEVAERLGDWLSDRQEGERLIVVGPRLGRSDPARSLSRPGGLGDLRRR